ncbi:MAG: hypothetical protein JEZ10_06955 [Verrucomicrobia bacterium]|nr:hypothetical protein [Verrucomicrobiota bacterium]
MVFTSLLLACSFSVHAGVLNEWGFESDPAGRTLSQAINSGSEQISFGAGDEAALATDEQGGLVCTQDDSGTTGMWTNGAVLNATLPAAVSTGVQYLRYDLSYDLSDTNSLNNSGGVVGFSFYDGTGDKVAGVALVRDVGAAVSSPYQMTELAALSLTGKVSIVAKVDLASQKMDVWYDLTGDVSGFSEASPVTNTSVVLASFDSLLFQSTGDIQPAGSSDEVVVDLLRTADSWASIMEDEPMTLDRKYLNEWTFERDVDGTSLNQAINSGTASPLAQFDSGSESTVFTTNRSLLCTGEDSGAGGGWTNGALLDAALTPVTSGKHYLRYDVEYDFSSTNSNDSGNLLGVYFTDGTGDKAAGLVLGYEAGTLEEGTPANRALIEVTKDIPLEGTLIAIAEVDLDNDTLKVWYDLSGANVFDENSPAASMAITQTSIDKLRFHATGDFRPAGSADYAAVDNIRQAASWSEITLPPIDEGAPPELQITVDAPSGVAVGETNLITIVISNSGGPATELTSTLIHDGGPSAFTIVSNNTPVSLGINASVTNTYWLTASVEGPYVFTAQAWSAKTNSAATLFNLAVGSQVRYLTNSIVEVSGGLIDGEYEPGETIDITVVSTNDGGRTVTGIVNTLSPNLTYFSAPTPASDIYSSMAVGTFTSTTYRVTINPSTPAGTYWFSVTNQADGEVWADVFSVDIFVGALPSVSPPSIVLSAVEGQSDTATVTVTNAGNSPFNFTITDDSAWGVVYTENADTRNFSTSARTPLTMNGDNPETEGISDAVEFGFNFPLYGVEYSKFFVASDGVILLGNSTNAPEPGIVLGTLPSISGLPLIAPFWDGLVSPARSIYYEVESTRVIISYVGVANPSSGGIGLEFQAILSINGDVEFRYKEINGSLNRVTVGIQGDSSQYQNVSMVPASGTSVLISSQEDRWVSYSPTGQTVGPQQSADVTFTLEPGPAAGSANSFTAQFDWSSGGSGSVSVSAGVLAAVPEYSAVSSLSFTGAAGRVTSAPFVITNTGTGALEFTINDTLSAVAGYTSTNPVFKWVNLPTYAANVVFNDPSTNPHITPADEGFSDMIPFGFVFPFYGASYTQLCVSVNGALRLDTAGRVFALWDLEPELAGTEALLPKQMIAPLWSELVMDDDSSVKYHYDSVENQMVVTWAGLRRYGYSAGSNYTFQVVLRPSGEIIFQYQTLDGTRWPEDVVGLRDTFDRTVRINLVQPGDWTVETNLLNGLVTTQYVDLVRDRAVRLDPAQIQTIRYTPGSGTVAAGETAEITIIGDASNQSDGSGTAVTNATLTITHNAPGNPDALAVTFTATNSLQSVFVPSAAGDADGDGVSDDAERIAGTDLMDADSVFTPEVKRTDSGPLLSWERPMDGVQRTYNIYWSVDLMSAWSHLATVTSGTTYLDAVHSAAPVIYYRVTAE